MKIGIITMHKVLNYGSALQAYALQYKLLHMGYTNELIDYNYSNKREEHSFFKSVIHSLIVLFRDSIIGFPRERKILKFKAFYNKNFLLTHKKYNKSNIDDNPPVFDLYLTGSDQVWNPRFIGNDVNFMLAFTPDNALRMSYASSFATNIIADSIKARYSYYLSRYNIISVREHTGIQLVNELTGKDATVCCDPTLLLTKQEWNTLVRQSSYSIRYKYILVYTLSYMFNPYPQIYNIIDRVQETLGYKTIFLIGRWQDVLRRNSKLLKSAGPADFAYLFNNAEFVITTSFHGTAFALINDKPLIGVVNKESNHDSRIQSLLESVNAKHCIYDYREKVGLNSNDLMNLKGDKDALNKLRDNSELFLKTSLHNLLKDRD